MKITKYLICAAMTAALVSCEKEIDFDYHEISPLLVIEGAVSENGTKVALTNTTPMDEPMDKTCLTDAYVTVTDLTEGVTIPLVADADGMFRDATPGVVGHEYELRVERAGKVYTSVRKMLPEARIIGVELNWIRMPYDDVATLDVTFRDNNPAFGDYYWVRLYRNGEAYLWSVVDDRLTVDGVIDEVIMMSRRDTDEEDEKTVLYDGDVITVKVTPISKETAIYLTALANDSNGSPMFSGDFCLGYFSAAQSTSQSVTFHPDEITYFE